MDKLLYLLPALMCPVGMGAMMWLIMRDRRHDGGHPTAGAPSAAQEQELARLRKEVEALRDEVAKQSAPNGIHTP